MSYRHVPVKQFAGNDQQTELFAVYNTNSTRLLVLAVDANTAASLASAFNHVRKIENAVVGRVDLDKLSQAEPKFASSLRRALASRIQGPVRSKDGFAMVDGVHGQVFTPLSVVE